MGNGNETPQQKLERKLQWYKWLLVATVGLFVAGFGTREYLAAFASTKDVDKAVTTYSKGHAEIHNANDSRMQRFEDRTDEVIKKTEAMAERQKLNTFLMELRFAPKPEKPTRSEIRNQREKVKRAEKAAGL